MILTEAIGNWNFLCFFYKLNHSLTDKGIMTAQLLNGKHVAEHLAIKLKKELDQYILSHKKGPGLAVILIGSNPASTIYVNNKRKMAKQLGFSCHDLDLPEQTSEQTVINKIEQFNEAPNIAGILVQLPLPAHIINNVLLKTISPYKDVDGFHPYNFGRLAQGNPLLRPCTPYGIIQLLNYYQIDLVGKHAVIIGSSNIVGRPMALELLHAKMTVTLCNKVTKDLKKHIKTADLLVVATGVYNVVNPEWLLPHQIVIDVGIHRTKEGFIHGDINFVEAEKKVAWITPVPGGVGPMTVLTLMQNTWYAANHSNLSFSQSK